MEPKYINLKYLHEISGDNRELILEMIDIFNTEVPLYLELMNDYLEKKDWDALRKLAHKAKASALIMGMQEVAGELKNLELLAKEKKDSEHYRSNVRNIEKHFTAAMKELTMISKTL